MVVEGVVVEGVVVEGVGQDDSSRVDEPRAGGKSYSSALMKGAGSERVRL